MNMVSLWLAHFRISAEEEAHLGSGLFFECYIGGKYLILEAALVNFTVYFMVLFLNTR